MLLRVLLPVWPLLGFLITAAAQQGYDLGLAPLLLLLLPLPQRQVFFHRCSLLLLLLLLRLLLRLLRRLVLLLAPQQTLPLGQRHILLLTAALWRLCRCLSPLAKVLPRQCCHCLLPAGPGRRLLHCRLDAGAGQMRAGLSTSKLLLLLLLLRLVCLPLLHLLHPCCQAAAALGAALQGLPGRQLELGLATGSGGQVGPTSAAAVASGCCCVWACRRSVRGSSSRHAIAAADGFLPDNRHLLLCIPVLLAWLCSCACCWQG